MMKNFNDLDEGRRYDVRDSIAAWAEGDVATCCFELHTTEQLERLVESGVCQGDGQYHLDLPSCVRYVLETTGIDLRAYCTSTRDTFFREEIEPIYSRVFLGAVRSEIRRRFLLGH